MNMLVILIVVLIQIAVFQFVSVFLARTLPRFLIGERNLPADLLREMERFRKASGRTRLILGGLLAAAALVSVLVRPLGPGEGKLILAGISLASTLGMIGGYLKDRRAVRAMQARSPDSGIRLASLEPRTLWRYYHPAWEAAPIVILGLSAAFTAWTVSQTSISEVNDSAGLHMIANLALQGFLILGFLIYTFSSALTSPSMALRLPMFRGDPEAAFVIDEALRGTELRYFIAAKIGIALLLGLKQVEIAAKAFHHPSAPWLDAGGWALVVLLLVLFGLYIVRVVKISRLIVAEGSR